ncbi:MAG: hypothetical protein ABI634_20845 [Acidobacteriota bacterium]
MFALMLGVLACASRAEAQVVQLEPETPSVSIYAGAGLSTLFRGDLAFTNALGGEAGIRVPLSRRVFLDTSFAQFRDRESSVVLDLPIQSPTMVIGHVDRLEQRTERRVSTVEFAVVSTGTVGRVRVAAGGGAGLMVLNRTFRQTLIGCSPAGATFCGDSRTDFTSTTGTVFGLGSVDVRLTRRVGLYGSGRFVLVLRDVGSSGIRVTGGVRMAL